MAVLVDREARPEGGYVAHITIDNQAKLNTINRALALEIVETVKQFEDDAALRLVILTGAGERAFIGGADLNELAHFDQNDAAEFITLIHRSCDGFRRLAVPVIARIDGYALGAGLEVAVSCDLRVATTRAKFGMPEVKVGLPSVVEAALIPRLIGYGRARELLMLGETIDAETALRWGLVERVVAPELLDHEVEAILSSLLTAGAQAVRLQKALMQRWEQLPADAAVAAGIDTFVRAFATDEPARMLSEFVEQKRK
jgi:enoyl-CoA hydratase/carnithine racemase